MRARFWRLVQWLRFCPLLYRLESVEYIRFGRHNEYLISLYRLHWPITRRFEFVTKTERAIGRTAYGRYFTPRLIQYRNQGTRIISHPDLSLEEFTAFAREHPILYKDSWVKMRLEFLNHLPQPQRPVLSK